MSRLKLKMKKWHDKLASMPESGMGYQIVDVKLKSGTIIKKVRAYNGEFLDLPPGYDLLSEDSIDDITLSH